MGDHWGEDTVMVDGQAAYTQKYHENDGAAFLRNGPERTMTMVVHNRELAIRAVKEKMRPIVAEYVLEKLNKGENNISVYLGDDYEHE